jgi:rRNA biogenesis protein RRP5
VHRRPENRHLPTPLFFLDKFESSENCVQVKYAAAMPSTKRKAEAAAAPAVKEKDAQTDRAAKRTRTSDAPPKTVFNDEERAFPRGGASVLTPLEHKQIQVKANQDVLFEQAGTKKRGGEDHSSDGGSDVEMEDAAKAGKKRKSKKSKKAPKTEEEEQKIRVETLSYKVGQNLRGLGRRLTTRREPSRAQWS